MSQTPPAPNPTDTTTAPSTGVGRRAFLFGGAGLAVGAGGVRAAKGPGWRWDANPAYTPHAEADGEDPPVPEGLPEGTKLSYAQFGDDLVASSLLTFMLQ